MDLGGQMRNIESPLPDWKPILQQYTELSLSIEARHCNHYDYSRQRHNCLHEVLTSWYEHYISCEGYAAV
jgi:hypothetical protein